MKLTKLLITSLALVTIGSFSLFAVDGDNGAVTSSANASSETTTVLDSATGNIGDNVKIIGNVADNPLVTSLYYNSTNITKDTDDPTYIYDTDWDVQTGFTTDTFGIAVEGSTGSETDSQLLVAISATPFFLSTSNDTVYAGKVTIAQTRGASTTATETGELNSLAKLTIKSDVLTPNTYYNGLYASTSGVGQKNGLVAGFTITAEPTSRVLPSGRYVSTVTLAYSMK